MLKNSFKLLFLFSLFSGTMISINSVNWLSVWLGLEINLLSFIPLLMKKENSFSAEASLKYFLVQALASSSLLFSIILFFFIEQFNMENKELMMNFIFSTSLMMKAGIPPFHYWFPNVMEGLSWMNNLILMTWQKLAPLIILSMSMNIVLLYVMIFFSTMTGAVGGLNQTSLRKLLAFSSINHLGWMVLNLMINENTWKVYFIFYSFLSLTIVLMFNYLKIFNLNQMFSLKINSVMKKFILNIPLLSLGGLPPFLGFYPKWLTIEMAMINELIGLILMMIFFTLMTLYFYIRISYSSMVLNHNSTNWNLSWNFKMINNNILIFINFYSIFGLLMINLVY